MFLNIPQDPNIIWDANISLSVIYLSPFIGTFILWDVDNLLLRLISEEHRQSMVDSTRKHFYGVESVVRGNADSLLNWAADHRTRFISTTETLTDLKTDLVVANNNILNIVVLRRHWSYYRIFKKPIYASNCYKTIFQMK